MSSSNQQRVPGGESIGDRDAPASAAIINVAIAITVVAVEGGIAPITRALACSGSGGGVKWSNGQGEIRRCGRGTPGDRHTVRLRALGCGQPCYAVGRRRLYSTTQWRDLGYKVDRNQASPYQFRALSE